MELAREQQNIISWLSRAYHEVQMYLDKKYEHLGISGYHHAYITIVCRNPGISQKKLKDFFMLDPSNITRSLIFLEKTGYLRRERDSKDKRAWNIYPTKKALQNYDEIVEIFENWKKEVMGDFTVAEQEAFGLFLRKITRKMEKLLEEDRKI